MLILGYSKMGFSGFDRCFGDHFARISSFSIDFWMSPIGKREYCQNSPFSKVFERSHLENIQTIQNLTYLHLFWALLAHLSSSCAGAQFSIRFLQLVFVYFDDSRSKLDFKFHQLSFWVWILVFISRSLFFGLKSVWMLIPGIHFRWWSFIRFGFGLVGRS